MEFQYRGLKAKLSRHIVTDQELEQQLQNLLKAHPKLEEVTDRPAALGDELVLDYAGFCDGEQFAGGTAENQSLTLGSGTFIPGFEEQLVGANVGDKVVVEVTFPQQYHAENLAGKAAQFHCTVHGIRLNTPRELTDDFAKEVFGIPTAEALKKALKDNMQAHSDQQAEMELQDQLLRQAADTLSARISPEELTAAVDEQMERLQAQLAQQGLSIAMYTQFMGTTEEALRQQLEPEAMQNLKIQKTVDRIVLLEAMTVTEAELETTLNAVCSNNGLTRQQLQPHQTPEFMDAVRRSILTGKVMDLLRQWAKIEVE